MAKNKRLLVICGPTATGKTALGIKLAKKFGRELISADSRQVYRGMDIGTGKDHPQKIRIYLIDVVNPNEPFNVAQYVAMAAKVIKDIWKRGQLPILVGGTGFYIKALVDGIETIGLPPDWALREKLERKTLAQLQQLLQKVDPRRWQRMNQSDRNNPRRLIRAIEIASKSQRFRSTFKMESVLFVGLTAPNKILYQRIDQRVDERVKQGVLEEIKSLLVQGYSWDNSVLGETIGYREFKLFFDGKINLEVAIQRWKFAEHSYARRQLTWFKKALRQAQGVWFDITKKGFEEEVEKLIKTWYSKNDAKEN